MAALIRTPGTVMALLTVLRTLIVGAAHARARSLSFSWPGDRLSGLIPTTVLADRGYPYASPVN
jgi:hypothetical protein